MSAIKAIVALINMLSRIDDVNNKIGLSWCLNKDVKAYPGRKTPTNSPADVRNQLTNSRESMLTNALSFTLGNNRIARPFFPRCHHNFQQSLGHLLAVNDHLAFEEMVT